MKSIDEILQLARDRARQNSLPYSGALLPDEAHTLASQQPACHIVDVRTQAELDWVGRIPGAIEIEWQTYPGSQRNARFIEQLRDKVPLSDTVLFICRSGARSHGAAMAAQEAGYNSSYNVLEGFEGDKNAQNQRNQVGGWRHAGLPWIQS